MHQMPADAQKKDPLVFLRTAVLFCYGNLPGAWIYEGKIRVKKSERELYYGVKTVKAASEEDLELLVQKREDNKRKRKSLPKK